MYMQLKALNAPVNPVGEVKNNPEVVSFIDQLKAKWDETKTGLLKIGKVTLSSIARFLVCSLDALIVFANSVLSHESGADRKATVLAALAVVYDYVVKKAIPVWLLPFSGTIKLFVIYTVGSIVIDWIVGKYNEGTWKLPS